MISLYKKLLCVFIISITSNLSMAKNYSCTMTNAHSLGFVGELESFASASGSSLNDARDNLLNSCLQHMCKTMQTQISDKINQILNSPDDDVATLMRLLGNNDEEGQEFIEQIRQPHIASAIEVNDVCNEPTPLQSLLMGDLCITSQVFYNCN